MFLTDCEYLEAINAIISSSDHIDLAVAFWGKDADLLLASEDKVIRIVCQLHGGGTNPEPIRKLWRRDKQRIQVRTLDTLHAKVVIGDAAAIVGSANFSTNGLGYEVGQNKGWNEAGLRTESAADLAAAQKWFDEIWEKSSEIDEKLLAKAEQDWITRQKHIPPKAAKSIFEIDAAWLSYQDVYVCVTSEEVDEEAKIKGREYSATNVDGEAVNLDVEVFTNWPGMKPGQLIISVFVEEDGDLTVSGPYKVIDQGTFYKKGKKNSVFYTLPSKGETVPGFKLKSADLGFIAKKINRESLGSITDQDVVQISTFFKNHTHIYAE